MEEQAIVIEAFTELAPTYEEAVDYELQLFWGVGYDDFVSRLLGMLEISPGDRILDVATGTAVIPRRLAARPGIDAHIVGLDITPGMLERAQQKITAGAAARPPELICASAMQMPLPDDSFDVVICGLGTHHMDVAELISEVKRVLRPGGTFVMADVCANAFWRSPMGVLMLRVLIAYYGWMLRRSASKPSGSGFEVCGLKMTEHRAEAEIEAFKHVLTSAEWRDLLQNMGFHCQEMSEIPALRRIFPGGLILKAVANGALPV